LVIKPFNHSAIKKIMGLVFLIKFPFHLLQHMVSNRYILLWQSLFMGLSLLAACSKEKPAEKTVPATVDNARTESDLARLTLTEKAVQRLGIRTVRIDERPMSRNKVFPGEIVPVSGQSVAVTSPVAATVLLPRSGFLPLAGKKVTQGQELYRLVVLPSERDLLGAQAEAGQRQVQYEVAQEKVKRATRMFQEGSGSQRALQEAEAELAAARASLLVVRSRVQLLRGDNTGAAAHLSSLVIKAPISGTIQRVYFAPNQVVAANTPVIDLVSLDKVWVRVPVYAGDQAQVEARQPASVRQLSDLSTSARLFRARPIPSPVTADPLTTSVDLFYELPNPGNRFRPGQRVSVSLSLKGTSVATVTPYASLIYDIHGGSWVYENPEPGVFVRSRVEVDYIAGNLAVLRRGPAKGTAVVTDGAAELFGTEFGGGK
jgi:RND family efflux transporter MFP subunit